MKNLTTADEVIICLALRSEIRKNSKSAKLAIKLNLDAKCYIDNILDLIHAYNAFSGVPFETGDTYVMSLIEK